MCGQEILKQDGKLGRNQSNLLLKDRASESSHEFDAFRIESISLNVRQLKYQRLTILRTGENVQQLEPSSITGRKVNFS